MDGFNNPCEHLLLIGLILLYFRRTRLAGTTAVALSLISVMIDAAMYSLYHAAALLTIAGFLIITWRYQLTTQTQ